MPDSEDVMWLAGPLEGEGSFDLANGITPRIRLIMTDLDVVIKAAIVIDAHTVVKMRRRTGNKKTAYYLALHGGPAIVWMRRLCPHMGERRSTKINQILEAWSDRENWIGRRKQAPQPGPRLSSPNRVWTNPNYNHLKSGTLNPISGEVGHS